MTDNERAVAALAARGTRGGLTAGQYLGSDEVHHLCERVVKLLEARNSFLKSLLTDLDHVVADEEDGLANIRAAIEEELSP